MNEYTLRTVNRNDAAEILAIYSPYIESSHITFETEVPALGHIEEKIQKVSSQFPWYVAEKDGPQGKAIVGYAYASLFRERAAYAWALETSIYIQDEHHGTPKNGSSSVAKLLYDQLFAELKQRGTKQVIGVISLPNEKSVRFHEKFGFEKIGVFPSVGFKQGKWWDVLFMTKFLESLPFSDPR